MRQYGLLRSMQKHIRENFKLRLQAALNMVKSPVALMVVLSLFITSAGK